VGIWGINIPVGWGFAIVNFVWWIGIGHAGTLISAILLLLHQKWRTSINRFAEAMTLFAVACAGLFPLLHMGRPQFFYWLTPYPNTMGLWPQWRSPLVWDVFLFWYVGLIPDMATLRDRSAHRIGRIIYGILAMGWRGSARHWHRYESSYLLLAGLATPLVVSVHTVVSFDFAVSIIPGWHSTIFPPYFVAGALFSGFAMVLTLTIPIRAIYRLEDFITMRHLNNMARIVLATGMIVTYGYGIEAFMSWYSGNEFEQYVTLTRAAAVVPERAHQRRVAVWDFPGRQPRHVAGAVRHRRHQPAPRLPPLIVGHVLSDDLGLGDLHRHHRPVPVPVVPVRALLADDLDLRDAHAAPRGARR